MTIDAAAVSRDDGEALGDLYQTLSAEARKGRALVQTPAFVREFILARTLTLALAEFGLAGTRLIDPACGTGHFLVDAYRQIWSAWMGLSVAEQGQFAALAWGPAGPPLKTALAQLALYQVVGVDLDPACVRIARYRLTLEAWAACGVECVGFRVNVFWGDALLHGRPRPDDEGRFGPWPYDAAAVRRALAPGQYEVVVANPPYITCKDAGLREAYRERYPSCRGHFSLGVPFTELCCGLARPGGRVGVPPDGGGTVPDGAGSFAGEVVA